MKNFGEIAGPASGGEPNLGQNFLIKNKNDFYKRVASGTFLSNNG